MRELTSALDLQQELQQDLFAEEVPPQDLVALDDYSRRKALEVDSFIVEAPAGAGKTELLTQRYLRLLQTVHEPEEIIAITFTNKAAAEMRSRILDSLVIAAGNVPPHLPHKQKTYELSRQALQRSGELGWRLLENPARLRIFTIDSLSSHLARQMPLLSRFGAQPAITEDAGPHYRRAAELTLDLSEGGSEAVKLALRYVDNDAVKLTQLLADMLAKRDQWLSYANRGDTPQLAEMALTHLITQDIGDALRFLDERLQKAMMPAARFAAANLPCEARIALLRDWETPVRAIPHALPMWLALCELLLTSDGSCRKRFDKNLGLPATPEAKIFKEMLVKVTTALQDTPGASETLARLRKLPQPGHDDESWQMVAALAQLLNLAVAQLWVVFQEVGEVDFVEVSQRALHALADEEGAPTDLALKLDYRIQHLLVDEFQDTSPGQVQLLQRLTRGWTPGDGRTLFAVGDPMQSIYRFRKANVGLFLDVARNGIGDIQLKRLQLCRNNRSCPPVVDWINTTFSKVFPPQDSMARGAIRYREFVATRADEPGTGVHVYPIITTDEESAEAARQREAACIVDIIRQQRVLKPEGHIAVLVRARGHLESLVGEIRRNHRDLHFQAVEIEALAGRQVIQDLLALAHAMHHRADRVHWLAILRAPWCGLKLRDLHVLAADDRHSTIWRLMHDEARVAALSEDGRQRLLHVRQVLGEALAQQGRMPTGRWLRSTWLMLGGAQCLWEQGDVRDVQAFFALVERLEGSQQLTLGRLTEGAEKLYAAPDAHSEAERLQFMTIHKSKGLEFDAVILPGLDRRVPGNDSPLLLWEEVAIDDDDSSQVELVAAPFIPKGARKDDAPTPYDYLKLLEKERAENEDARVLYVAATRAECSLHLVGIACANSKGELKPSSGSFLSLLWPEVGGTFLQAAETQEHASQPDQAASLADFIPRLARLREPRVPPEMGIAIGLPKARIAEGDRIQAEDLAVSIEAHIGTLAHRYMEMIAVQGIARWNDGRLQQALPMMQLWLRQQGHTAEQAQSGADRVCALLVRSLRSRDGQWVLKRRSEAKTELALATVCEAQVRHFVVDRTFVEDDVRWIIDYKSAAVNEEASDAMLEQMAEYYRSQLEGYAQLFAGEGLPTRLGVFFLAVGRLILLS